MSRHRGAKRCRRYGLLGIISLLSPAYPLSVERWPFHAGPPDPMSDFRLSTCQSRSQASLCHCLSRRFPTALSLPSNASVTLWEATAPVKLPTMHCPGPRDNLGRIAISITANLFHIAAPHELAPALQSLPPILHKQSRIPVQSYSKGARGLSSDDTGTRIFTGNSVSLSLCWRQRKSLRHSCRSELTRQRISLP